MTTPVNQPLLLNKLFSPMNISNKVTYQIGGINIQIKSDLPINENTFNDKLLLFKVSNAVKPDIRIRHHFDFLPRYKPNEDEVIYNRVPWQIYKTDENWVYYSITPQDEINSISFFDLDYSKGNIYNINPGSALFQWGGLSSLTLYPTDQILVSQLLYQKSGFYIHSSGIVQEGKGLLFVGHSGAGKSTITKMLMNQGEILCDDRVIIRDWPEGPRIYGTWSHGEIPEVSSSSAPLYAIFLLEQSDRNQAIRITNKKEIIKQLPFFVIKPLVTAEWWHKTFDLIEQIANEVPVYRLLFDKSGAIEDVIRNI